MVSLLTADLGSLAREALSTEHFLQGFLERVAKEAGATAALLYLFDDSGFNIDSLQSSRNEFYSELILAGRYGIPVNSFPPDQICIAQIEDTREIVKRQLSDYNNEWNKLLRIFQMKSGSELKGVVCALGGGGLSDENANESLCQACKMLDLVTDRFLQRDLVEVNRLSISLGSLTVEDFMCRMLEATRDRLKCEGVSFFAKDQTQEHPKFWLVGTSPQPMPLNRISYSLREANCTSLVLTSPQIVAIHYIKTKRPDIDGLHPAKWRDVVAETAARTVIFVPVVKGDDVVGLLRCTNKSPKNSRSLFNAIDIHRADAYASLLMTWQMAAQKEHRFAASLNDISHEFKTSAAGIKSAAKFVQRLLKKAEQNPESEINLKLKHIVDSTERLIRVLPALRKNTVPSSGTKQPISFRPYADLCKPICEMFRDVAKRRGLEFIFSGTDQLGLIYADLDDFKEIFQNLVSNAVKYSLPAHKIFILFQRAARGVEYSIIHVASESIPVLPKERDQLFRFRYRSSSARQSGTEGEGLGLAIAQAKARHYHGDVVYNFHHPMNVFSILIPRSLFTIPE